MGIKFTTAEDAEVVRLKEQVGGSWKSIQQAFAAVFPGTTRKYNDLQVRYTRSLKPGEKFRAAALALGANGMFSLVPSITAYSPCHTDQPCR